MKTSIQAYSNRKFRLSCYNRNRNTDKAGTSTKLIYIQMKRLIIQMKFWSWKIQLTIYMCNVFSNVINLTYTLVYIFPLCLYLIITIHNEILQGQSRIHFGHILEVPTVSRHFLIQLRSPKINEKKMLFFFQPTISSCFWFFL